MTPTPPKPLDYSPAALSRRLQLVEQLRSACLRLAGPRLRRPWGIPPPAQPCQPNPTPHSKP